MNDCLAATGSTGGIDPLLGAIALLLVGVGIGVLVWRNRRRGAVGIALLPLVLGILVFGGVAAQPAQAAPCPPPAACVPTTVIDDLVLSDGGQLGATTFEGEVRFTLQPAVPDQDAVEAFYAAIDAADAVSLVPTAVTLSNDEDETVVFQADEIGTVLSAVPALPADFTIGDVWDLVGDTLGYSDITFVIVFEYEYETGCGTDVVTLTYSGDWTQPVP